MRIMVFVLCGMLFPMGAFAQTSSLTQGITVLPTGPDLSKLQSAPPVKCSPPAVAPVMEASRWTSADRASVVRHCRSSKSLAPGVRADRKKFCDCYAAKMEREHPKGIPVMTPEKLEEATARWTNACDRACPE